MHWMGVSCALWTMDTGFMLDRSHIRMVRSNDTEASILFLRSARPVTLASCSCTERACCGGIRRMSWAPTSQPHATQAALAIRRVTGREAAPVLQLPPCHSGHCKGADTAKGQHFRTVAPVHTCTHQLNFSPLSHCAWSELGIPLHHLGNVIPGLDDQGRMYPTRQACCIRPEAGAAAT